MTSTNTPYNNSSDCLRYKTNEKEVLRLNDECSYFLRNCDDFKTKIGWLEVKNKQLKVKLSKYRSGSQTKEKALGAVGSLEPNANLRALDSPYHTNKENDTKYGFAEDKDKHFDGNSSNGVNRLH